MQRTLIQAIVVAVAVVGFAYGFTKLGPVTVVAEDKAIAASAGSAAAKDSTETFVIGTAYGSGYRTGDLIAVTFACSSSAATADSVITMTLRNVYAGTRTSNIGEDSVVFKPNPTANWSSETRLLYPTADTLSARVRNIKMAAGKYRVEWRPVSQE